MSAVATIREDGRESIVRRITVSTVTIPLYSGGVHWYCVETGQFCRLSARFSRRGRETFEEEIFRCVLLY
jgi:hypothetical protein